jgi:hypothetical protein
MVEIKCCGVRVVAALRATTLDFYGVYQFAAFGLKPARVGCFVRRVLFTTN